MSHLVGDEHRILASRQEHRSVGVPSLVGIPKLHPRLPQDHFPELSDLLWMLPRLLTLGMPEYDCVLDRRVFFLLIKGFECSRQEDDLSPDRNCFRVFDMVRDEDSPDEHRFLVPINVLPLEGDEFACPKAGPYSELDQISHLSLGDVQDLPNLFQREGIRFTGFDFQILDALHRVLVDDSIVQGICKDGPEGN